MRSLAHKAAAEVGAELEPEKPVRTVRKRGSRVSVFDLAKGVPTESVLARCGFVITTQDEKSFTQCVHCKNDDSLICEPNGGVSCLHETCREPGSTQKSRYRSNIQIVAERLGLEPLEAAKKICEWEGIEIPKHAEVADDGWQPTDDDAPDAPPVGATSPHNGGKFARSRIEIIDSEGIFAELAPPDYLIDGLIVRGTIAEIIAYGYSGKSWMGVDAVNSVGAGVPFLERFSAVQGDALLMDYESGKYECRRRLKLYALGRDLVTPIAGVSLVTMPALYMTDDAFPSEMERLMDGRALLVLDTLKAANPRADENSSEMRVGLDYIRRPCERTQCAVIVLAHAKKTSGSATTIDPREAGRGSSAIFDAADTVLHVTYVEGEPLRVQQTKARCGKAVAPFLVEILDTLNGGVRVVAKDEPKAASKQETSARFDALCDEVLAVIRANHGCSGRVVREHVKARPGAVGAALETLERHGAVRNAGTDKLAKWFPITHGGES